MKRILIIFPVLFLLYGCSISLKKHSAQVADLSSLRQDFTNYWNARMKGDYKTAWRYELPSQRFVFTFDQYRQLFSDSSLEQFVIKKIEFIHPHIVIIQRGLFNDRNMTKKDKWFFIDGKWYHKFYQNSLPPSTSEEWEYQ